MVERSSDTQVLRIIKDSINRIPHSNCLKPLGEVAQGLEHGRIDLLNEDNPVVLVERKKNFAQLYYFMSRGEDMPPDAEWEKISEKIAAYDPLYADITVKGEFEYRNSIFEKLGLTPFRVYLRTSCVNDGKEFQELADLKPRFADVSELEGIQSLIGKTPNFDVMSDHLPDDDELKRLLLNRNVLVIEIDGNIVGVQIFEDVGTKSYGRLTSIAKEFQDNLIAYSLGADYRNRHRDNTKLFYAWVDQENKRAYRWQTIVFGQREDGLRNYIFKR